MGLYSDPEIYDILHAPGTSSEARGLERIGRRFVGRGPLTWLEPACGTGRYLRALAARGHRGVGFDLSGDMIAHARRAGRCAGVAGRLRFFRADMTDFASAVGPRRVDAAFNLINTIRHLGSDRAMLAHLREIRAVLRPGGVYLVGISLTAYGLEFPSEDVWIGSRAGVRVTQVVQFVPPLTDEQRRERAYSHLVISRRGAADEHRDSRYWLRCYSRVQWLALAERAGFEVAAVTDADGRDTPVRSYGYAVWVLRPGEAGVA
jgi:SAM-dependent methyltransferase